MGVELSRFDGWRVGCDTVSGMPDQTVSPEGTEGVLERRAQILDCTCRVIARDGADGLRMAAVAREADVSSALLHYYFATREILIGEAFEYHDRRETSRGRERVLTIADPIERIRDVLARELSDDDAVHEGWVLWSEMQRLGIFNADLRAVIADRSQRWVSGVADLVRAAQQSDDVGGSVDADSAALRLTAIVDGLGGHIIVGSLTRAQANEALDVAITEALRLNKGTGG